MDVVPIGGVSFGYNNILKTYFKQGKFKGLKSFTGEELTKVSLDHIIPHSHGGASVTGNYILTNVKENTMRDTQSIDYYLDRNYKGAMQYIGWFLSHKVKGFDCLAYALSIIKNINRNSKKYIIKREDIQ